MTPDLHCCCIQAGACKTAAALTLAAVLVACGQNSSAPNPAAMAVPAKLLKVSPQRVPITLETVGQVEGSKEVEVRARVGGILLKRMYNEGEVVRAASPLFQIDPAPFEIALAQARAQLAQEKARNEQARRESGRLKQLAEQRAISQKEYDDSTTTLKLSDATLQAAEANVRQADLNLSYTLVTAPVAGITGRGARSEGSLITAGADSLLTTVSQVDPIWVRFSLSDSDLAKLPAGRLGRGAATEVRLVLPDGNPYAGKGRINFAATQIDPRLATQQLRAEFDNPQVQLLPGQFVRVQIVAGQRENVFLVPQTAVLQTEKGYFVFTVDKEEKAAIRPVKAGDWVGRDWIILDGLATGDRVIVDNLLKLRPGTPVTAAPEVPPAVVPAAAPAAPAK
jgi:membrane fusion protein (multidrug efflux system)